MSNIKGQNYYYASGSFGGLAASVKPSISCVKSCDALLISDVTFFDYFIHILTFPLPPPLWSTIPTSKTSVFWQLLPRTCYSRWKTIVGLCGNQFLIKFAPMDRSALCQRVSRSNLVKNVALKHTWWYCTRSLHENTTVLFLADISGCTRLCVGVKKSGKKSVIENPWKGQVAVFASTDRYWWRWRPMSMVPVGCGADTRHKHNSECYADQECGVSQTGVPEWHIETLPVKLWLPTCHATTWSLWA